MSDVYVWCISTFIYDMAGDAGYSTQQNSIQHSYYHHKNERKKVTSPISYNKDEEKKTEK